MYRLIILSAVCFAFASCDDMAKKVDSEETIVKETVVKAEETVVKPTLSSNLVMNTNTAESTSEKKSGPNFSFNKELHDFGQLVDGEKVSYSFTFTNSGDAPLIISSAKGSCGCTVPDWPKDPIAPGESGSIDVTFNSSGRSGKQNKAVTLTANTNPSRKVLNIISEVISK